MREAVEVWKGLDERKIRDKLLCNLKEWRPENDEDWR